MYTKLHIVVILFDVSVIKFGSVCECVCVCWQNNFNAAKMIYSDTERACVGNCAMHHTHL